MSIEQATTLWSPWEVPRQRCPEWLSESKRSWSNLSESWTSQTQSLLASKPSSSSARVSCVSCSVTWPHHCTRCSPSDLFIFLEPATCSLSRSRLGSECFLEILWYYQDVGGPAAELNGPLTWVSVRRGRETRGPEDWITHSTLPHSEAKMKSLSPWLTHLLFNPNYIVIFYANWENAYLDFLFSYLL